MERTSPQNLTSDELLAMVLWLQERLEVLEVSHREQAQRIERQAKEWLPEFDAMCQLLAVSAVVYTDETSWSISSVWAFLSEQVRLTISGCRKDTLTVQLKKETFTGTLVSDDAAVSQGISHAQECWAHLLRKAIRWTLLQPDRPQYREFLDSLLEIYRKGKAIAADKRLGETGRRVAVRGGLCLRGPTRTNDETPPTDDTERDFINLTHEIARLLIAEELFTYAIHPQVDGTNNISERQLRQPASPAKPIKRHWVPGAGRLLVVSSIPWDCTCLNSLLKKPCFFCRW